MASAKKKFAFIDRDGTIVEEPHDEQVDALEKIRFVPGVIPALRALQSAGFDLIMVTNQDGLGTEAYPEAHFELTQSFIMDLLRSQGITFSAVHIDRTYPHDRAETRKPGIGMVREYLAGGVMDFDRSFVVGDRASDIELAKNMGLTGHRIGAVSWDDIVDSVLHGDRVAEVVRETNETSIRVRVALEGTGTSISTGVGFFDHMLDQIAVHGGFGLSLECTGDLHVDEHHTIEDCGLALGEALSAALGDRRGIGRFGFVLPMDDARATIAIDLGGRPYLRFDADFARDRVGEMPTEMVPHFFRSLAQTLGATIHVEVLGDNAHHKVEAVFKGFGRALRTALKRDGGRDAELEGRYSMIAVIRSTGSNFASVRFAVERLGGSVAVTEDPDVIRAASHVILPGVGSAATGMRRLEEAGLVPLIPTLTQPVLGICLGMQVMYDGSTEGDVECLGIFRGTVRQLEADPERPVPHMGWNTIRFS